MRIWIGIFLLVFSFQLGIHGRPIKRTLGRALEDAHQVIQDEGVENFPTSTNTSKFSTHKVKVDDFQTNTSAGKQEKQDSTTQGSIYVPKRRYSGYEEAMFRKDQKLVDGGTYEDSLRFNGDANDKVHTTIDRTQETGHAINFQEKVQDTVFDGGEKEGGKNAADLDDEVDDTMSNANEGPEDKANDRNIDPLYEETHGMGSSDIKDSDSDFTNKESELLGKNTTLRGEIDEELTGNENNFAEVEERLNVAHKEDEGNKKAVNQTEKVQEGYEYQTNESDIDLRAGRVDKERSYSTESGEIDDRVAEMFRLLEEGTKPENTDTDERLIRNEDDNEVDYEKKDREDKGISGPSGHGDAVGDFASDTREDFEKISVEQDSSEKNSTSYSEDKEEIKHTYTLEEKDWSVNLSDRITKDQDDLKSGHVRSENVNDRRYNSAKVLVRDEEDKRIGNREEKGSENKYKDEKSDVAQSDGKDTNESNHEKSGDQIDSEKSVYFEKAKTNDELVEGGLGYYGEVKRGNNETSTAENSKGRFDVPSEITDHNGDLQNETFEREDSSHKKSKETEFIGDENKIGPGFVDEAGEINAEEIGAVIEDRNTEGYGVAYDSESEEEDETRSEDNEPDDSDDNTYNMEANQRKDINHFSKYEEPFDEEYDHQHSYDEQFDSEESAHLDQNKFADDLAEPQDDSVSSEEYENYLLGNFDIDAEMSADFAQEDDLGTELIVAEEDALFH